MAYEYGERLHVEENRARFLREHHINPGLLQEITVSHSCNIALLRCDEQSRVSKDYYTKKPLVEHESGAESGSADGLLTFDNLFIGILVADCIPLFVYHQGSGLHGIVHVGLMGALNDIVSNLSSLYRDHEISPGEVNYYIGPGITRESYNLLRSGLWQRIKEQVHEVRPEVEQYLTVSDSGCYIGLQEMLHDQLLRIGACAAKIHRYPHCTARRGSHFFSHYALLRAGKSTARFLAVIGPTSSPD